MDSLPIINKIYEIYKTVLNINEKIDKRKKYGLGVSLETSILECMEKLIMAKNAPKPLKFSYLVNSNAQLEIAVLKLRIYLEMKLVNETRIFQLQTELEEVGRMLGGWIRSCK